jgi:hypothetical protein
MSSQSIAGTLLQISSVDIAKIIQQLPSPSATISHRVQFVESKFLFAN